MLLAIDAGNTNIVFGVFDQEELVGQWRLSTSKERTVDEYAVFIAQIMELKGLNYKDINAAVISTVVPGILFDLRQLCKNYLSCLPIIIGDPRLNLGISLRLERPSEVGADIVANSVAAYQMFGGNLIVVDFGTATTFHVLDNEGNLLGGAIAPGINISAHALHIAAAKLPKVAVEKPDKVIGNSTVPAMQAGIYWGYIGMVEGIISKIEAEYGSKMKTIATGGLASLFVNATDKLEYLEPNLTIYGLRYIYQMNKDLK